jgi:hypothetical protein
MIISAIPVDPARTPDSAGNPIPTEPKPPVPSSIMVNAPSPGIIRHPIPTYNRIPAPSSIIIRPPIRINTPRYPDISIRLLVNPTSVIG